MSDGSQACEAHRGATIGSTWRPPTPLASLHAMDRRDDPQPSCLLHCYGMVVGAHLKELHMSMVPSVLTNEPRIMGMARPMLRSMICQPPPHHQQQQRVKPTRHERICDAQPLPHFG